MVFIDVNKYILTEGGRGFKTFLKKIMQLLWIVVTYLLENVKHGTKDDIDSTSEDIRHSWNLHQIWSDYEFDSC